MLPKKNRFNLRYQENLNLLRRSKRVHGEFFTFYYFFDRENASEFRTNEIQVAVTVSKKVNKLAVKRNAIKRKMYSFISSSLNEKNLWKRNIKIVFVVRKGCKESENHLVKNEIYKMLEDVNF